MSQAEIDSFIEKTESEMQKHGKVVSDKKADRKKLAYPIKDEVEAWLYFFNLYPEAINKEGVLENLEKTFKEDKNILRFMVIDKDTKRAEAAARRGAREKKFALEKASAAEPKEEEPKLEEKPKKPKIQMEDIDKKLDEMLGE